eukprot:TRINITY_DN641_c0_g1_i1.p2 TRINITY_DN641_c0_g1~~TRINITY_DN641_c0_g1_i1.p2  ORF type:complete len:541 (-),score=168.22 TRINITY_DN641_c0_g1_i1:2895-4517(-)
MSSICVFCKTSVSPSDERVYRNQAFHTKCFLQFEDTYRFFTKQEIIDNKSPVQSPRVSFTTTRGTEVLVPGARVLNVSLAEELISELPNIPQKLQPKLSARIPKAASLNRVSNIAQYLTEIEKTKEAEEVLHLTQSFLSELNQELVDSLTIYEQTIKDLLARLLEAKALEVINANLSHENHLFYRECDVYIADINLLRIELEKLTQERVALRNKLVSLENDNNNLVRELEQTKVQQEKVQHELGQTLTTLKEVEKNLARFIESHKQLASVNEGLSKTAPQLSDQFRDLLHELELRNLRIKQLNEKYESLKERLNSAKHENDKLKHENVALKTEISSVEKAIELKSGQYREVAGDNDRLNQLIQSNEAKIKELESQWQAKDEYNASLYKQLFEHSSLEERKLLVSTELREDWERLNELVKILGSLYAKHQPYTPAQVTLFNVIAAEAERMNRILNPEAFEDSSALVNVESPFRGFFSVGLGSSGNGSSMSSSGSSTLITSTTTGKRTFSQYESSSSSSSSSFGSSSISSSVEEISHKKQKK